MSGRMPAAGGRPIELASRGPGAAGLEAAGASAPPSPPVRVVTAEGEARAGAFEVRRRVFVEEQRCPPEEEWDEYDAVATHFAALGPDGQVVGAARLVVHGSEGKVGRMAVLPEARRRGVGGALLRAVCEEARRLGLRGLYLHAQTHAEGFYARHGFRREGGLFWEAGIEHVLMRRALEPSD